MTSRGHCFCHVPHFLLDHISLVLGISFLTDINKTNTGKKTIPLGNYNNKVREWQCGKTLKFYFKLYTTMFVCVNRIFLGPSNRLRDYNCILYYRNLEMWVIHQDYRKPFSFLMNAWQYLVSVSMSSSISNCVHALTMNTVCLEVQWLVSVLTSSPRHHHLSLHQADIQGQGINPCSVPVSQNYFSLHASQVTASFSLRSAFKEVIHEHCIRLCWYDMEQLWPLKEK